MTPDEDFSRGLVNQQLTSVEFVMDYLQLKFNGGCLTALTPLSVVSEEIEYQWTDALFCNALRKCITTTVRNAVVNRNEQILIELESGRKIIISLDPDDYRGPEAVIFINESGDTWVW